MLLEEWFKNLKASLEARTDWAVYDAFDPASFDGRPDWFLTLGLSSLEMQDCFWSQDCLYYSFTAKPRVTLFAPPETNANQLYNTFCRGVISGMLSSGCTVCGIQMGTAEVQRQFRRLVLYGDFCVHGVMQMRKEEVGMT